MLDHASKGRRRRTALGGGDLESAGGGFLPPLDPPLRFYKNTYNCPKLDKRFKR